MRLLRGLQLNTSLHPTSIGDGELQRAFRVSRDKLVLEADRAYRQVDPIKTPSPTQTPDQGCTGFGFGAYQGIERFILANGDALFATNVDTSEEFLERTTDGDTTLMDDLGVHAATDEHTGNSQIIQHRGNAYVINRTQVKRVGIETTSDNETLGKSYDSSIYDPYYTLTDYLTRKVVSGSVSISGGTAATATITDGAVRILDEHYPSDQEIEQYTVEINFGAGQTWPINNDTGYIIIPLKRDEDGALLPTYGTGGTLNTYYNHTYINGVNIEVGIQRNVDIIVDYEVGWVVNVGNTAYLIGYISGMTGKTFSHIGFKFCAGTNGVPQKFTAGPVYLCGESVCGEGLAGDPELNGNIYGFGSDPEDDDYQDYAFRGSDAGETTFGEPTLVRLRKSLLWHKSYFEEGSPTTAYKTVLASGTVAGGHSHVQFLKLYDGSTWKRLGLDVNDGAATITDDKNYSETSALTTVTGVAPVPPPVEDVVCGTEWKGHLVMCDYLGRAYFSDQTDPSVFIWRDYVDGGSLSSDTTQPRSLDISGQNDEILAVHGLDSIYFLTRRRVYFMSGSNATEAYGPYQIQESGGSTGMFASCSFGNGILYASDEGLMFAQVQPNTLGRSGDVQVENLTIKQIEDSWIEFIGDADQRTRVSVVTGGGHIWAFRDDLWIHMTPAGLWSTGQWATGLSVTRALTDGLKRIAIAFSDNSVGYIGEFPTDGGVTPDGDDGTEFEWIAKFKTFQPNAIVDRIDIQQFPKREPDGASVYLYSDRNSSGTQVKLLQNQVNVPVPKTEGGVGSRWFIPEVRGSGFDVVTQFGIDPMKATDERSRV